MEANDNRRTCPPTITACRPFHSSYPGRPSGDRQRQLLAGLVAADHGIHVRRAAIILGLNWNTTLHHARRLEAAGRILVRRVAGRLCLFDASAGAVQKQVVPVLLREPRTAELVRVIVATPGINQNGLAAAVGLTPSAIHRRMVRLEEAGLVRRERSRRNVLVSPTDALLASWDGGAGAGLPPPPAQPDPVPTEAGPVAVPWVDAETMQPVVEPAAFLLESQTAP